MRSGDWKLVSAYDYSTRKFRAWELYNIADDRSELIDLGEQNPDIKARMINQYEEWCERVEVVPKEILDTK
jgi:arylsulfatase